MRMIIFGGDELLKFMYLQQVRYGQSEEKDRSVTAPKKVFRIDQ